jgi:hypothetical protein
MSAVAKHQIIQILDDLPEQSLADVAEFVDFLRAKALLTRDRRIRLARALPAIW